MRRKRISAAPPPGFGLTLLPELAARAECAAAPGLRLARFARPEPPRTIGLVRRSLSVDDGWFGELAAILSQAGDAEVAQGARISQSPAVTTSKVV
jgi:LysR family hydrogen peroxide-inducible transcriptional activator